MNDDSITRIFCDANDFCARLERYCTTHLLPTAAILHLEKSAKMGHGTGTAQGAIARF
jgi:hypothetical protein